MVSVLSEILSSKARAKLFEQLLNGQEAELYVRELERRTGYSIGTIQTELKKLSRIGLVKSRRDGNRLYYKGNKQHPLYNDFCSMVAKTKDSNDLNGYPYRQIKDVAGVAVSDSQACEALGSEIGPGGYMAGGTVLGKEQVLKILSKNLAEIQKRFCVKSLALFGSAARGEIGPESDLDIMVTFQRTPGMFGFLDLKDYLEGLFRRPVDLVTEKALKEQLRDRILQEIVDVR